MLLFYQSIRGQSYPFQNPNQKQTSCQKSDAKMISSLHDKDSRL